jgi:hypothetical protein
MRPLTLAVVAIVMLVYVVFVYTWLSTLETKDEIPAILTGAVMLTLALSFVSWVWESGKKFAISESDPFKLVGRKDSFKIYSRTGIVVAPSSRTETHVYSSMSTNSQGYSSYSTSSSSSHHQQWFLRTPDGRETSHQFTNWNIPMHEGHTISAAWAIRTSKRWRNRLLPFLFKLPHAGPTLFVGNHSTGDIDWAGEEVFRGLIPARREVGFAAFLVYMFSIYFMIVALDTVSPDRQGAHWGQLGIFCGLGIAQTLIYCMVTRAIIRRRIQRFKVAGFAPLFAALKREAASIEKATAEARPPVSV